MKHNKKLIKKIAIEVQSEYQMGGLADGLYLKFATDVAIKYTNAMLLSEGMDIRDEFKNKT